MYREKGLDFFSTDLVLGKIVVRERNDDLRLLLANYEFPSLILYVLDVLWCQQIKLIHVVSTSEFHEY